MIYKQHSVWRFHALILRCSVACLQATRSWRERGREKRGEERRREEEWREEKLREENKRKGKRGEEKALDDVHLLF